MKEPDDTLEKQLAAAYARRVNSRAEVEMAARVVVQRRSALRKSTTAKALVEAKAYHKDAIEKLRKADEAFEAVLVERLTGSTGLPLVDAARSRGANGTTKEPLGKGQPEAVDDAIKGRVKGGAYIAGSLTTSAKAHLAAIEAEADLEGQPDRKQWFEDKDDEPTKARDGPPAKNRDRGPAAEALFHAGWTIPKIQDAVNAVEGLGGDGTKTVVCYCGRTARPAKQKTCIHCGSAGNPYWPAI